MGTVYPSRPSSRLFGIYGLSSASVSLHGSENKDEMKAMQSLNCALIWGVVAWCIDSQLIGFFAVVTLYTLGFTSAVFPFGYMIGFEDEAGIFKVMTCPLTYIYAALNGLSDHELIHPFRPGILIFGAVTYMVGCLIISNRHYSWEKDGLTVYVLFNIIAFASTLTMLVLGSTLYSLENVGGTFLTLLLDKYTELPWGELGLMWGAILYGCAVVLTENPDWVIGFSTLT